MKRVAMCLLAMAMILPASASPADNAKLSATLTAPTTMGPLCTSGDPITGTWAYTVQYRAKGSTTWLELETASPTAALSGLLWSTTYEVRVGAHRTGYSVACWSTPVEKMTASEPPPGACGTLVVVAP